MPPKIVLKQKAAKIPIPLKPLKQAEFKGKTYQYRTPADLAKTLKITVPQATELIANPNLDRIIINPSTGQVNKQKIKDAPLVWINEFKQAKTGIRNRNFIADNFSKKDNTFKVTTQLSGKQLVNVWVEMVLEIQISDEVVSRHHNEYFTTTVDELDKMLKDRATDVVNNSAPGTNAMYGVITNSLQKYPDDAILKDVKYRIFNSAFKEAEFDLKNGIMRDEAPVKLDSIFNEVVPGLRKERGDTENCVRRVLISRYPDISSAMIDKFFGCNWTVQRVHDFCVKYGMKMIGYDQTGEILMKHKPDKTKRKALIFVSAWNHIYLLKNKLLNKKAKATPIGNIKIVKDADTLMIEYLNKKVIPSEITLNGLTEPSFTGDGEVIPSRPKVFSFVVDGIKYLENDEYVKCYEILSKWGIQDRIHDKIKVRTLGSLIEKIYCPNPNETESFFPNHQKFTKGGYYYRDTDVDAEGDVTEVCDYETEDKNKSYSSALKSLPYLLRLDYRQSKIVENPKEIVDHYLYIVRPDHNTILLPCVGVYWGNYLLRVKNENDMIKGCGLGFTLLEEISTTVLTNHMKSMVNDIYKKFPKEGKEILNSFIGCMEQDRSRPSAVQVCERVCNDDEINRVSGVHVSLTKDNKFWMNMKIADGYSSVTCRKPISIQIKDESRWVIYQRMKELQLSGEDIIQINVDSFTHKKKDSTPKLEYDEKNIDGWKLIKYKPIAKTSVYDDLNLSFFNDRGDLNDFHDSSVKNKLYYCKAGHGKSYDIRNTVIPQLLSDPDLSYRVLTPSHVSLTEYRESKLVCDVIQSYTLQYKIPKENTIIIDELGLCDRNAHDLIYKCYLMGKRIIAYGDFDQLLPVKERSPFNSRQYIAMMFQEFGSLDTNYRNHFTDEYYNQIINGELNAKDEIIKWSTPNPEDAKRIIVWRNTTADIYNERMMKHLGFSSKFDVGITLLCNDNGLADKDLYNGWFVTIVSKEPFKKEDGSEETHYKLSTGQTVNENEIKRHFDLGYACTAYGIQGQSIESYYYAPEDDYFIDSRLSYTVVSRLKTK